MKAKVTIRNGYYHKQIVILMDIEKANALAQEEYPENSLLDDKFEWQTYGDLAKMIYLTPSQAKRIASLDRGTDYIQVVNIQR